jgi:Uma2 family endonuclease
MGNALVMPGAALHRFSVKDFYRMAVVKRLNRLFHRFAQDRWLMAVQDPVHLEDDSEPQPDLMLLKPAADDYESRHPKPDDVFLLIEVSDATLETDREVKVPVYGRAGIAEVWIVNLDDGTLEVYREPNFDGYASIQILHKDDKVAPAQFPDAVLEVADLLGR